MTTDPISLADYRYRSEMAQATAMPLTDLVPSDSTLAQDLRQSESYVSTRPTFLGAQVLRKLNPDTKLASFFDIAARIIAKMEEANQHLSDGRPLDADNAMITAKPLLGETFILREISDAVGVISLTAMQAISCMNAISDVPELPHAILRAMNRLWSAPYMTFADATKFAEEIEAASKSAANEAFNALVNELLAAQGGSAVNDSVS